MDKLLSFFALDCDEPAPPGVTEEEMKAADIACAKNLVRKNLLSVEEALDMLIESGHDVDASLFE